MSKTLFVLVLCIPGAILKGIEMVWHGGEKTANNSVSITSPGSRTESGAWYDVPNDKAYLFGGHTYDKGSKRYILTNDLWHMTNYKWKKVNLAQENEPSPRYSPSICGIPGVVVVVYGGIDKNEKMMDDTWIYSLQDNTWQQLVNSSFDHPAARGYQSSWCLKDQLIVFGGRNSEYKLYHDMWSFSLANFKWTEMDSSRIFPTNGYGEKVLSYPKPRSSATTFTFAPLYMQNTVYLFGGNTANVDSERSTVSGKYANDLWKYDVDKDVWTKIGGNDKVCHAGIYGHLGVTDHNNWPGCRVQGIGWVDSSQNLWIFGGAGSDSTSDGKLLNDLWHYDFTFKMWAWMDGNKYGDSGGKYEESNSCPGSRKGFAAWNPYPGNRQYIYGGKGHDVSEKGGILSDLWMIDVSKYVVYSKYPSIGGIFMIIFGLCGLILVIVSLSIYNRRFFKFSDSDRDNMSNTQYSMLHNVGDQE